jgi:hypothetical protein
MLKRYCAHTLSHHQGQLAFVKHRAIVIGWFDHRLLVGSQTAGCAQGVQRLLRNALVLLDGQRMKVFPQNDNLGRQDG